jgi:hypothetical protein
MRNHISVLRLKSQDSSSAALHRQFSEAKLFGGGVLLIASTYSATLPAATLIAYGRLLNLSRGRLFSCLSLGPIGCRTTGRAVRISRSDLILRESSGFESRSNHIQTLPK